MSMRKHVGLFDTNIFVWFMDSVIFYNPQINRKHKGLSCTKTKKTFPLVNFINISFSSILKIQSSWNFWAGLWFDKIIRDPLRVQVIFFYFICCSMWVWFCLLWVSDFVFKFCRENLKQNKFSLQNVKICVVYHKKMREKAFWHVFWLFNSFIL